MGAPRATVPAALVLAVVGVVLLGAGVAVLLVGVANDRPAASVQGGAVVRDAWATPGGSTAAVYLTIDNRGGADQLLGASSANATAVRLMVGDVAVGAGGDRDAGVDAGVGGGVGVAVPLRLDLPTGVTDLGPDGPHLVLVGLDTPLAAGDTVPLRLDLRRAGPVRTEVTVVTPEEAAARGG